MKQLIKIWLVAAGFVLYWCSPVLATTYYVNPGESIQSAIETAFYGDTIEAAAGTYHERITLKNGVAVIGAGAGSAVIDAGSGSVVTSYSCDANTILEGFTITGGYASRGGGMYNMNDSNPTVTNCTFSGNSATSYGGGMCNYMNSSPTVTNCTFSGNSSTSRGGGMFNDGGSPTVTNCTFSGNSANYYGGGMYNYGSSPTITNCTFSGNSANYYGGGGGMYNNGSTTTVTNCVFVGNLAFSPSGSSSGGGMYHSGGSLTVTNCTFSGNSATTYGGGICNIGQTTVANCIMWGDSAGTLGDEIYNYSSTMVISYSDIAGSGGSGAGWNGSIGADGGGNIDAGPLFGGYFHLRSEFGRATTDPSIPYGTWLIDTVTSPCIDAGDPSMDVGNEPEGNGGRINMGYYGGTYQASKSSYVGTILGDVNGDGKVDFLDFAIMAEHWLIDCDVEPLDEACMPK